MTKFIYPEQVSATLKALTGTRDMDAIREAILIQARAIAPNIAHPDAARIADRGDTLGTLAAVFSGLDAFGDRGIAVAKGLSTGDFRTELANIVRQILTRRFRAGVGHRDFAKPIPVKDFKDVSLPVAGIDASLLPQSEAAESEAVMLRVLGGLRCRVKTYSRHIYLAREAIVNNEIPAIGQLFGGIGAHAARLEAKLLFELLASNPTLGDSEPMFHTDHGNAVTGVLSLPGLDIALGALRNQTTGTEKADSEGAHLLVPAALEATAKGLVHNNGLGLKVHATGWLSTPTTWYVLADPEIAPCVGLLHLEGSDSPGVGPDRDKLARGGALMFASFEVGVAALDRIGAVQVTAE